MWLEKNIGNTEEMKLIIKKRKAACVKSVTYVKICIMTFSIIYNDGIIYINIYYNMRMRACGDAWELYYSRIAYYSCDWVLSILLNMRSKIII